MFSIEVLIITADIEYLIGKHCAKCLYEVIHLKILLCWQCVYDWTGQFRPQCQGQLLKWKILTGVVSYYFMRAATQLLVLSLSTQPVTLLISIMNSEIGFY